MRKVKLQMQVSVDGFVAGPAGERDWLQWKWDADLLDYVDGFTKDCILFGHDVMSKNSELAERNSVKEIRKLKHESGHDIIVYGGSSFVSSLLQENLIDELHFFVNPTAIGKGMAIFRSIDSKMNLQLVNSRPFDCGVVLLFYKPE